MIKINKKLIGIAIACQFLVVTLMSAKASEIKDEIQISVSDATGEKTNFNYTKDAPSFTSKSDIVLKGESYGDFSIKSTKYNTLQYKTVKSITDSSILNSEEGWKDINLNEQKNNNNDVITDKKGFLKHRAYDVNHIGTLTDANKWNNREVVYKTPYSGSAIISAKRASSKNEYGESESYLEGRSKKTRWVNKTIFINNMEIDKDYKEASKIWGYIKVDDTASYNFQSLSDDGLSAYIIVDGVTHKIVDGNVMFKLHGRDSVSYKYNGNSRYGYEYGYNYKLDKSSGHTYEYTATGSLTNVNLDKDKYYPIYIEYFNWGGGAALEMNIKKSDEGYEKYKQIPESYFYPSKSDYPGEYADSIFTGADGVKLPTESGRYYIAYRAVNKNSSGTITEKGEVKGTLGPYLVESRAKLDISKSILTDSGDEVVLNNNRYSVNGKAFKIKYDITPLPITLEELIADSKIPSDIDKAPKEYTMTISDPQIQTLLPDGLNYAKTNENSVVEGKKAYNSIGLKSIVYKLDKDNKMYNPITKKVSFIHTVSGENYGEYTLSEEYSKFTFKDVDGGNRELKFNTQNIVLYNNTDIIENMLYNLSSGKKGSITDKTVVKTMLPSTLAFKMKVNSLNPEFHIKINGIENKEIEFIKYELNSNGEIYKNTKESKFKKGTDFTFSKEESFKLEMNKEYLIIYEIRPKKDIGKISITIQNENGNGITNQEIKAENPPILK